MNDLAFIPFIFSIFAFMIAMAFSLSVFSLNIVNYEVDLI